MEIWGHCRVCDRWFYCPVEDGDDGLSCPVCSSTATTIEKRATT